ncbi:multidrug effflux MFS transporter [Pedobacter flavus]|uniref:Multidrug effflux MFS transporter n=1 Tax=Pedobacter flavus TaxID=3113906 RepID=A0ABU7H2H3_9SPHI|nr:multidrug effflux MFS transporter [Pedobacter sp. VNH31]MEE1884776.1 multidrug effflux MFS transporter [Pedobacter sp. VNH31]
MKNTTEKFTKDQLSIVIILGILSAMGPFTIDMYLPAFVQIADSLSTTQDQIQLSLASYFIGISAGQLFYGPITDRFGRKKPLYIGLIIYTLASIGCGIASNIDQLIAFRLLQALGGCAGMVVSRAVVRDLFKPHESAKVFSMLMLVMGIAPIIAPSVGSFVSTSWGWRAIFTVLTCLSSIVFVAIAVFLPESKKADKSVQLKFVPIIKVYWNLMKKKSFIYFALCCSFGSAGMFAYISSSSFIYITLFNFTEKEFSLLFSVNAAGLILCSQLNRILLKKYSMTQILTFACGVMFISGISIAIISNLNVPNIIFIAFLFVFISFLGFIYPNSTALALADTGAQTGSASALLGALQMFMSFVSSIAVSTFFNNTIVPVSLIIGITGTLTLLTLMLIKRRLI